MNLIQSGRAARDTVRSFKHTSMYNPLQEIVEAAKETKHVYHPLGKKMGENRSNRRDGDAD